MTYGTRKSNVDPDEPVMIGLALTGWMCSRCFVVVTRDFSAPPPTCGNPCVDFVNDVDPALERLKQMDKASLADLAKRQSDYRKAEQAREKERREKEFQRELQLRYFAEAPQAPAQPHPHAIRRLKEDGRLP